MQVAIRLLLDRLDDRGVPMTRVLAADPAREIDVGPTVGIGDARASACATTSLGVDIPGAT